MVKVLYPINLDRWKFPVASSLRELTLRNLDIDFYSFSSPSSQEDKVLGEAFWNKPNIHKISTIDLLQKRFDIVHHASATKRNLGAAYIAKARSLGKCTHIFTAPIQPHQDDSYYREYVHSVHKADVLAAVSYAVADDIKAQFNRQVDAVIPSGVDLKFFASEASQPLDLEKYGICQPYVLFVGILTQRKRPDIFLQIASLVPELDFVMIGGAYTSHEQKYYASSIGECPNAKYLGALARTNVRNFMGNALALVFPSELEGLPLTILEALAMGLPVLAQPKSSMPEAVIENLTGWLFSVSQPSVWAEKLKEIASWSDEQRSCFARRARTFVAKKYSWDTVARQYAELYQKLM